MSALVIHCHNDDIPLWGSFSALSHRDVTAYTMLDSYVQPARGVPGTDAMSRRREDLAAAEILGYSLCFGGYRDDRPDWDGIRDFMEMLDRNETYNAVYIPAVEDGGHEQHNELGRIAGEIWPHATRMLSYTRTHGKSTGRKVYPEPEWIGLKLRALAEYKSQFQAATGCAPWFIGNKEEYYQ